MTNQTWPGMPSWEQIKRALGVKTIYLSLLLLVVGLACLIVGASPYFSSTPPTTAPAWATIVTGIGATLVTSAIFSFISETMVRLDTLEFFESQIQDLGARINAVGVIAPSDVTHIHTRRQFDFANFIDHASGDARILGFSANDVLSPANMDHWKPVLLARQVQSLKVLVVDPESPSAADRSKAPCYPRPDSFRQKCEASFGEIADLIRALESAGAQGLVHFRKIRANVNISMVSDGKMVLITPILWTRTGGTSPSFVVTNADHSRLEYATYIADFDALWDLATTVV